MRWGCEAGLGLDAHRKALCRVQLPDLLLEHTHSPLQVFAFDLLAVTAMVARGAGLMAERSGIPCISRMSGTVARRGDWEC